MDAISTAFLNALLHESNDLTGVIDKIGGIDISIPGVDASGEVLFVAFNNDGQPNQDRLAEFIMDRIVMSCVPPRIKERIRKCSGADISSTKLTRIALETLKEAAERKDGLKSSTGEVGELLLFHLIEALLGAPAIAYKIYEKANDSDQVKGADAVHARYSADDGKLYVYIGESKLQQSKYDALAKAIGSVAAYHSRSEAGVLKKRKDMIFVSSVLDLNVPSGSAKAALIEDLRGYIDPQEDNFEKKDLVVEVNACLMSWDEEIYKALDGVPKAQREALFIDKFRSEIDSILNLLSTYIGNNAAGHLRFHFFIMPFKDIYSFQQSCELHYKSPKFVTGV